MIRASSSSETSARIVKPERICVAPYSMRADGPGLGQHLQQRRAEGRRARVAGFQFVQAARQLRGRRDLSTPNCRRMQAKSSIARIQQLHQVMLDLDVVVRAGQAESRGRLQRKARRVIQFRDE